jgi:hypothetical protein
VSIADAARRFRLGDEKEAAGGAVAGIEVGIMDIECDSEGSIWTGTYALPGTVRKTTATRLMTESRMQLGTTCPLTLSKPLVIEVCYAALLRASWQARSYCTLRYLVGTDSTGKPRHCRVPGPMRIRVEARKVASTNVTSSPQPGEGDAAPKQT